MKEMDHAETIAKRVLEAVLPGTRMTYRVDQSRGEHDFDLSYSDGSISAVEVTSSVDEAIEHAYARIRDTRKGGPMVKTKLCERDWLVRPALWADLRMVRAKVDQYLAAVEFAGIDRFWAPTDLHPSVERIYQNLGVVSGSVFSHWKEPGQIGIMFPTRGGAPSSERLPQSKLPTRKLSRSTTDESWVCLARTSGTWSYMYTLHTRVRGACL